MAALTQVSGTTRIRKPLGNRWQVYIELDSVNTTGHATAADLGLSEVDYVVGAVAIQNAANVIAEKNSQSAGGAEDDLGDVFLTASADTDVGLTVVGR